MKSSFFSSFFFNETSFFHHQLCLTVTVLCAPRVANVKPLVSLILGGLSQYTPFGAVSHSACANLDPELSFFVLFAATQREKAFIAITVQT